MAQFRIDFDLKCTNVFLTGFVPGWSETIEMKPQSQETLRQRLTFFCSAKSKTAVGGGSPEPATNDFDESPTHVGLKKCPDMLPIVQGHLTYIPLFLRPFLAIDIPNPT